MRLSALDVSYRYREGAPAALEELSLEIPSGDYICVSGPNGSGKTTFLKLACGLLPARGMRGTIAWDGRPLHDWDRLDLARNVAFVPGTLAPGFAVTVEEFALQGRFARSPLWSPPTREDRRVAAESIERAGVAALAARLITELSAGQLQLCLLARALAQQPRVLVLDEATTNLDLSYQTAIFGLLARLHSEGLTIALATHDLNLAAEFCPTLAWIARGRVARSGPMEGALTNEAVAEIYGKDARVAVGRNPYTGRPKLFHM